MHPKSISSLRSGQSEGAKFWLQVLTDLQHRGIKDILIASVDGIKGFPEAINSVFPDTQVQLCIVHQIRNSLRFIGSANQKQFAKELKKVYQAFTKEEAEIELDKLEEKRGVQNIQLSLLLGEINGKIYQSISNIQKI